MTLQPQDRLIVALDVPSESEAVTLVNDLAGTVSFFKVGYQLFLASGIPFVRRLVQQGHRVFLDLKMNDVPETISLAVREMAKVGVQFATIYGTDATVRAAVAGRAASVFPKILQVTLLTSMNLDDLADFGIGVGTAGVNRFATVEQYALWRGEQAVVAGCDGLVAAGSNVADLRHRLGPGPLIVCPGIRPAGAAADDHQRAALPRTAVQAGADYLVVGRPIRDASDRKGAARAIIGEIEEGLAVRA